MYANVAIQFRPRPLAPGTQEQTCVEGTNSLPHVVCYGTRRTSEAQVLGVMPVPSNYEASSTLNAGIPKSIIRPLRGRTMTLVSL